MVFLSIFLPFTFLHSVEQSFEFSIRSNLNNFPIKINKTNQVLKPNDKFLYPSKKPLIYSKISTKTLAKSKILKEKDYTLAKNIFNLIKKGKWNTAVAETKKVKDKDFKKLVTWLYLKQSGNQATFNDYKNFIDKNSIYPRIGRLRYMAEHKIILENTTPKTVINWFDGKEPLSGILAESARNGLYAVALVSVPHALTNINYPSVLYDEK